MNQRGPKHACMDICEQDFSVSCPVCRRTLQITEIFVPLSYKFPHTVFVEGICFTCNDRSGRPGRYRMLRYRQMVKYRFTPPKPLPVIGEEMPAEEIRQRLRKGDFEGV